MAATPEETLADERRRRTPAAVAAIVAGILSLLSSILAAASDRSFPRVHLVSALHEHLLGPQQQPPGLKARQVLYDDAHMWQLLGVALALALAAVAIGLALTFLYRAAYARRPQVGRAAVVVTIAGAVLVALPGLVGAVALTIEAHTFATASVSAQSAGAARDVLGSPVAIAALFLGELGRLLLGVAFVLVSLRAMSVGLLTRFMGVLGIIVGVLFVLPLGTSVPFVQTFWLIALAVLFLGRWPGSQGAPPAWASGEARPWPSQQELREARLARQEERGGARGGQVGSRSRGRGSVTTPDAEPPAASDGKGRDRLAIPETPAPAAPTRAAHPSSKKKKRKRR